MSAKYVANMNAREKDAAEAESMARRFLQCPKHARRAWLAQASYTELMDLALGLESIDPVYWPYGLMLDSLRDRQEALTGR